MAAMLKMATSYEVTLWHKNILNGIIHLKRIIRFRERFDAVAYNTINRTLWQLQNIYTQKRKIENKEFYKKKVEYKTQRWNSIVAEQTENLPTEAKTSVCKFGIRDQSHMTSSRKPREVDENLL
jgi:hypothetical protein